MEPRQTRIRKIRIFENTSIERVEVSNSLHTEIELFSMAL